MRLRRVEQVERNRELVLAAARRVFLARGYGGASLEAIAEEAGFSKGVVYSQFGGKADLFLALLERRIDERAEENDRLAASDLAGTEGVAAAMRLAERAFLGDPAWALAVIEFRVHAARDPALARRYAAAHERTVERLARVLAAFLERAARHPSIPPRTMAEMVLAFGVGVELERVANPESLQTSDVLPALLRALALEDGAGATVSRTTAAERAAKRRRR